MSWSGVEKSLVRLLMYSIKGKHRAWSDAKSPVVKKGLPKLPTAKASSWWLHDYALWWMKRLTHTRRFVSRRLKSLNFMPRAGIFTFRIALSRQSENSDWQWWGFVSWWLRRRKGSHKIHIGCHPISALTFNAKSLSHRRWRSFNVLFIHFNALVWRD